jgi:hypothetical protein
MSKDRSPTDYLSDSWGMDPPGGDNASGAGETGDNEHSGIPFSWNMPPEPRWGMATNKPDDGGYGHSDEVKETKGATWGMDKDEIAQGFERLKSDGEGGVLETRQPDGSFPQALPTSNPHDRGAGSDAYAREHSDTTGRGFDGRGHDISNPGKEQLGSRANQG